MGFIGVVLIVVKIGISATVCGPASLELEQTRLERPAEMQPAWQGL